MRVFTTFTPSGQARCISHYLANHDELRLTLRSAFCKPDAVRHGRRRGAIGQLAISTGGVPESALVWASGAALNS